MRNRKLTAKLDKIFEGVSTDDIKEPIIHHMRGKNEDDKPLIVIPKDKSYIEVLGYRIDGDFSSFESFIDYLSNVARVEIENKLLKAERTEIIDYLKVRLEESKLMANYENGVRYPCMKERIYIDILERIENGNYETNK